MMEASTATQPARQGRIHWIGGSKGGVGKSMMSLAMLDGLSTCDEKVMLVECDVSNPDVWKAYKAEVESSLIDLDEADGWIQLVNICGDCGDKVVVINTAARSNTTVQRYGRTLDASLGELGRKLVALWVINRQRDSLELLQQFMGALPKAMVHVVRNGYFGDERKFDLYNASKVRDAVESRGGKSLTLSDLADRVADDLYCKRMAIGTAAKMLTIGNRAELVRWRDEVRELLAAILT